MRVTIWKDVNTLVSHFLDQVLEFHWNINDPLDRRFVATGELDQGDQTWLQSKLSLNSSCTEGNDSPVGSVRSQLPALEWKIGESEG